MDINERSDMLAQRLERVADKCVCSFADALGCALWNTVRPAVLTRPRLVLQREGGRESHNHPVRPVLAIRLRWHTGNDVDTEPRPGPHAALAVNARTFTLGRNLLRLVRKHLEGHAGPSGLGRPEVHEPEDRRADDRAYDQRRPSQGQADRTTPGRPSADVPLPSLCRDQPAPGASHQALAAGS